MIGARQTIAVTIIFRNCNKNRLERWAGAYLSSRGEKNTLYFLQGYQLSHPKREALTYNFVVR
jgi:hypothetical protein